MFYYDKQNFMSEVDAKGYRQKVVLCLHNGDMGGREDGDISIALVEHITNYSEGKAKIFKNVVELIQYIDDNNLKLDKFAIAQYYNKLENMYYDIERKRANIV